MKYKTLELQSKIPHDAATEIMFEVASARAEHIEVMRLNIRKPENDGTSSLMRKIVSFAVRTLKNMKQRGQIQFYAMSENFERQGMESVFLINKYPDFFESAPCDTEDESFIYIKI